MAVEVRELYESRGGDVGGGIARCTRVFQVIGQADPAQVLASPGIPPYLEEIDYNGIKVKLKRYGTPSKVAPNICRIECYYDNDGASRGPNIPDTRDDGYKDINISWVRDVERVPAWILYLDAVPDTSPTGPYQYSERWEPYEFSWDYRYASAEVRINLPYMNSGVQQAIAAQVNSIHTFPDQLLWQFIGAQTQRTGESQWSITYSWIHDPGQTVGAPDAIMLPTIIDSPTVFIPRTTPHPSMASGSILLPNFPRPPFARYLPISSQAPFTDGGDPDQYRPEITLVHPRAYRAQNPNGWRFLPGNPIP